jgi:hypothetical protein
MRVEGGGGVGRPSVGDLAGPIVEAVFATNEKMMELHDKTYGQHHRDREAYDKERAEILREQEEEFDLPDVSDFGGDCGEF